MSTGPSMAIGPTMKPKSMNARARHDIRLRMRERRAALDHELQASVAAVIAANLTEIELLQTAETIAGYRAIQGEVNIDEVLCKLIDRGATVTVPRVVDGDLEFVEWLPTTRAQRSAFGISEPLEGDVLDLAVHDLVLAPLVAFDHTGQRLGQGGGFYDRSLARLGEGRPAVVGIAHAFQEVAQIPVEPWDVGLDAVVTETKMTVFRHGVL